MALTLVRQSIGYTVTDNNGKKANVAFYLPPTASNLTGLLTGAAPLVAALTDGSIVSASATISYIETEPGTPAATSEIERKLLLVGRSANGGTVRYSVPSPVFGIERSNTDTVDLTNAAVAALVSWITANASSSTGSDVSAITEAYVYHRYRRPKK